MLVIWASSGFFIKKEINRILASHHVQLAPQSSISFNPFIFSLTIENIRLVKEQQTVAKLKHAVIDVNIFTIFATNIGFDELDITGLDVDLLREKQQLIIAGIKLNELDKPSVNTEQNKQTNTRGIDLSALSLSDIIFNITDDKNKFSLQLTSLINNQFELGPYTQQVDIELTALVNDAPTKIVLKGDTFDQQGNIYAKVNIGQFKLSAIANYLPNEIKELTGLAGLAVSTNIKMNKANIIANIVKFNLLLEQVSLTNDQHKITLEALGIDSEATELTLNRKAIDKLNMRASVDLSLSKLQVKDNNNDEHILSIGSAKTATVTARLNNENALINIPKLDINALELMRSVDNQQDKPLIMVEGTTLNKLQLQQNSIKIDAILLNELKSYLTLDNEGQLVGIPTMYAGSQSEPIVDSRIHRQPIPTDPSKEMQFTFGQIELMSAAELYFVDQQTNPNKTQYVKVKTLNISNVTNHLLNNKSKIMLNAQLNDNATLDLSGTAAPFSEPQDVNVDVKLAELSLPEISPYSIKAANVGFLTGQLDADTQIIINNDELNGNLGLQLRGIELTSQQAGESATGGSISLNTALGMLKDNQGNIALDIPMSGNINDPKFGLASFLGLVTQKAIFAATESYLMQTFVPYANIVSIARVAGEAMLKVNVEDLIYAPQQTQIDASQMQFVSELVNLLNDKPEAQLKMCPFAVAKDSNYANATQNDLLAIAQRRGQQLKVLLVEEKGIPSKRLLVCQPQIDKTKNAKARIEFTF